MASVAITLAMIAPTKNPSSRLKITPQAVQRSLTLNGRPTIDPLPQAGHVSLRHRHRVRRIVRGSLFIYQSYPSLSDYALPHGRATAPPLPTTRPAPRT